MKHFFPSPDTNMLRLSGGPANPRASSLTCRRAVSRGCETTSAIAEAFGAPAARATQDRQFGSLGTGD